MKYYDLAGSPNTRRVRIFMAEKGLVDRDELPPPTPVAVLGAPQ